MEHWAETEEVKEAARTSRRQSDNREAKLGLAEHEGARLLRRYWFRVAGSHGFGVTAHSEHEATNLAAKAAEKLGLAFDLIEVTPDVDVTTLDQGHVIPNMGPPNFHGVWFPFDGL
jgi:phytoene/squalene synthetase